MLALLAAQAQAVQVTVSGTAPSTDNSGTCVGPVLVPMTLPNPALKMHGRWWLAGGDSINAVGDSVAVAPGAGFNLVFNAAPGLWRIRAWAADAGGVGCDTTVTKRVVKPPPDRVRDFR